MHPVPLPVPFELWSMTKFRIMKFLPPAHCQLGRSTIIFNLHYICCYYEEKKLPAGFGLLISETFNTVLLASEQLSCPDLVYNPGGGDTRALFFVSGGNPLAASAW
jgi:hypothetical protein